MARILIIDDDLQLCRSFTKILTQEGFQTDCVHTGQQGIDTLLTVQPDLVILDVRLPDINGLQVFQTIHARYPRLPVIIITAYSTTETAITAMQKGAFDYLHKPFDVPEMLKLVDKAVASSLCMASPVEVNPEDDFHGDREALVGGSAEMLEVYKAIGRVSATDATVLIRGESGTGKELAARALYNHSLRSQKPLSIINCVAIPETLLESELFGYEKGAFTGADHRRIGKIEQARGGTVFLDEIGDLPAALQAKFLRLLQEKSIERLGGGEPINVNVRVLAATNRDLETAVTAGTFREDLYYRLSVVTITMPALRNRKEDIPMLSRYLIARLSTEMSLANPGISNEALEAIAAFDWPGNIRELANSLKRALIFNRGAPLQAEEIIIPSQRYNEQHQEDRLPGYGLDELRIWIRELLISGDADRLFDHCLDQVAALLVKEALDLNRGNRSRAAKMLGISRPTLHAKIDKYHLNPDSIDK